MKTLLAILAVCLIPFGASGQQGPETSLVPVGPMPDTQEARGALVRAMQEYSRTSCGIAVLLRADPAAFPNETYANPQELAEQMGAFFARNLSLSTRIFLSERGPGPAIAMAHINGHLFAQTREFQNFNLRDFAEMGPELAVANHSIKAIQRALYEDLSSQNQRVVDLLRERVALSERARDLAEVQLLLLNTAPEEVRLTDAARANPRSEVERQMAAYLDARDDIVRFSAELDLEEAALQRSEADVTRNTCAFSAPDALYGSDEILTLKDQVAAVTGRSPDAVSEGDILRWIVETGFGTPAFEE